ncbi:MAG: GGDEF domain-containing protein, partial [Lachnospiraceae bacterium]|nr:GGDEF domain-containing protein [Lachnospiraceae bacterium]
VTPMVTRETAPLKVAFTFNVFFASMLIIWMSHFFVLGYKNSIDILAKKNTTLDEEASLDPLTGLYNRRTMETNLEGALEAAKKTGALFSLVMGDIDFFKRINDTYGHECGDVALVQVADILKTCVRDGDVVCRWGGEEFLLLVKGNRNVASTVAERIRARIENNVVEYGEHRITFTMTLGVSTYAPGYSLESLVTQADENLYYGKEHGRNQVVSTKPKVTSTVSSNV